MNTDSLKRCPSRQSPAQPHAKSAWILNKRKFDRHEQTGKCAENLVIWHLRATGWTILARNFQTHKGEIDVIASRQSEDLRGYPTVAFIEVKSRASAIGLGPEDNVTPAKRAKITATMKQWIGAHPRLQAVYRCDIASVLLVPHRAPRLRYFKNAFYPREQFGW